VLDVLGLGAGVTDASGDCVDVPRAVGEDEL
jgi:hypothetical protein